MAAATAPFAARPAPRRGTASTLVRTVRCWNSPALASTARTMTRNHTACVGPSSSRATSGGATPGSRTSTCAAPTAAERATTTVATTQVLRKVRSFRDSNCSNAFMPIRPS
jgi:hypothetical protein